MESIDCADTLEGEFSLSSLCLINNGKVIITVFSNPVSSKVILYNFSTNTSIRKPDCIIPKYNTSLLYHKGYLYTFGGRDMYQNLIRKAERILIDKDSDRHFLRI